jgi:RHS repeat-associated protein
MNIVANLKTRFALLLFLLAAVAVGQDPCPQNGRVGSPPPGDQATPKPGADAPPEGGATGGGYATTQAGAVNIAVGGVVLAGGFFDKMPNVYSQFTSFTDNDPCFGWLYEADCNSTGGTPGITKRDDAGPVDGGKGGGPGGGGVRPRLRFAPDECGGPGGHLPPLPGDRLRALKCSWVKINDSPLQYSCICETQEAGGGNPISYDPPLSNWAVQMEQPSVGGAPAVTAAGRPGSGSFDFFYHAPDGTRLPYYDEFAVDGSVTRFLECSAPGQGLSRVTFWRSEWHKDAYDNVTYFVYDTSGRIERIRRPDGVDEVTNYSPSWIGGQSGWSGATYSGVEVSYERPVDGGPAIHLPDYTVRYLFRRMGPMTRPFAGDQLIRVYGAQMPMLTDIGADGLYVLPSDLVGPNRVHVTEIGYYGDSQRVREVRHFVADSHLPGAASTVPVRSLGYTYVETPVGSGLYRVQSETYGPTSHAWLFAYVVDPADPRKVISVTRTCSETGTVVATTFDAWQRPLTIQVTPTNNAVGRPRSMDADAGGRVEPLSQTTTYTYGFCGACGSRPTSVALHPSGRQRLFEYDGLTGLLVSETYPSPSGSGLATERHFWSPIVAGQIYKGYRKTRYEDALGRQWNTTYGLEELRVDSSHGVKAGSVTQISPPVMAGTTASVSAVAYYDTGAPSIKSDTHGPRQEAMVGLLRGETDGDGVQTDYTYDARGLIETVVVGGNAAAASVTTEFLHDDYGRVTQVKERAGSVSSASVLHLDYNGAGRPVRAHATVGAQALDERFFYDEHGNLAVHILKNVDSTGALPVSLKGSAGSAREWIRREWHYTLERLNTALEDRRPLHEGTSGAVADAADARFLRTDLVWTARGLVGSVGLPNGATVTMTYDGYGSMYKKVIAGIAGEELTERVFVNEVLEPVRLIQGVGASQLVTTIDRNSAGVIEVLHEPSVAHPGGVYPAGFGVKFARYEFDTDILGQTTEARIVDETNSALMRKVKSFHDALGRVYRLEMPDVMGGPDIAVQEVAWAGVSKATRVTDSGGRFILRTFDALGRVTQVEDSRATQSNTVKYEFLDNTDLVARIKTNSFDEVAGAYVERIAAYTYDSLGRVTQVAVGATNPLVSQYSYFATGDVQTFTDPSGKVEKFLPDALGRLTQRLLPGAAPIWNSATHQDFAGSATSQLIQEDGEGRLTTSIMDFAGRIRAIAEPGSTVMPTAAAPNQPYGKFFVYDGASRVSRMHTGQDGVLDFVRDGSGRVLARVRGWNPAIAPEDHIVSLYYGADLLEWDALGRPVQMRCLFGDGSTYVDEQFTYDGLGRQTAEKFKDLFGAVWNTVESKFVGADPFRREVNYIHGAGGTADDLFVATTPTTNGRLGAIGWATTAGATKIQLAEYSHEGGAIRKRRTFIPTWSLNNFDTTYSYDHYGRMTEVANSFDVDAKVKLHFDPVSHLPTGFEYKKQGDALAAGDRFAYDEHHRLARTWLSSHSMSADPDTVAFQKRMTYGMDEANNRTSLAEKLGQAAPETVTGYTPDSGATTAGTPSNRYEDVGGIKPLYDTRGNLVFDGQFYIVYDANNRVAQILKATLASSSSMAMSSSWAGELEGGSLYGEAASLESGPVVPMTSHGLEALEAARSAMMARIGTNPAALLQRATDPTLAEEAVEPILIESEPSQLGAGAMAMSSLAATSQPVLELVAIYVYDAFNRRVGRFVNQVSYFSYTWDGWHEAEEYRNATVGSQYVWGEQLDELVAYRYRKTNSWASFYVAEGVEHSPARILNQSGAVSEIQEYDPYGRTYRFNQTGTPIDLSAVGNPYGWKGHRVDDETGFVYMRNRFYHTGWGRFLSSDPIGVWGDGGNHGNQYAYGWLLPTAVVDRHGKFGWGWIAGAIIGVVVSVVVEAVVSTVQGREANYKDAIVSGAVAGAVVGALIDPATAGLAAVAGAGAIGGGSGEIARQAFNGEFAPEKVGLAMAGGAIGGAAGHGLAKAVPVVVDAAKRVVAATASSAAPAAVGAGAGKGASDVVRKAMSPVAPNPCPIRTVGTMARVSGKVSDRAQLVGRTPGKTSRTGREVIERMEANGTVRLGPDGKEFLALNGRWYPIAEADMSHIKDAVTWWNETGRGFGARATEVRQWMLDSANYVLDHFSLNRSAGAAGAALGQRYLPALK